MIGNKRLNEKGFLLLETIVAWSVLTTCLMIYLPFLIYMLQAVAENRNEVECARIGLEQVQKLSANKQADQTWETAGKTYFIFVPEKQKGIRVNEKDQEWKIQMESFITLSDK